MYRILLVSAALLALMTGCAQKNASVVDEPQAMTETGEPKVSERWTFSREFPEQAGPTSQSGSPRLATRIVILLICLALLIWTIGVAGSSQPHMLIVIPALLSTTGAIVTIGALLLTPIG